jgi:hypothetical protein
MPRALHQPAIASSDAILRITEPDNHTCQSYPISELTDQLILARVELAACPERFSWLIRMLVSHVVLSLF